uniref:DUF1542 domain-containing protein n=1 Tax=Streptococcus sp. 3613 TaxID=2582639 RepID=UPI001562AD6D
MDFRKCNREKVFRYSIRKYHFGAASVAVAALMFLGARASVVQADTTVNATEVSLESSEPKSDPAAEGASEASNGSERSADQTSNSVQPTPVGSDRDASPSSNNGESSEGSDRSNSSAVSGSDRGAEETSNSGQHAPVRRARSVGENPDTVNRGSQSSPVGSDRTIDQDRGYRGSALHDKGYVYGVDQDPVPDEKYDDKEYLVQRWPYAKKRWLNANLKTEKFITYTDPVLGDTTVKRKVAEAGKTGGKRDNVFRDEITDDLGTLDIFNKHPTAQRMALTMDGYGENFNLTVIGNDNTELLKLKIPKEHLFIRQSEWNAKDAERRKFEEENGATKQNAKDALEQEATTKIAAIDRDGSLTKEEKDAAKEAVNDALQKAKDRVDSANTADDVEREKTTGNSTIRDVPQNGTTKQNAKDALEQEATTKIAAIDRDGSLTKEEKDAAKEAVNDALQKAKDRVDSANTADDVEREKTTGNSTIRDVPQNGTTKSALNAELGKESGTKESDKYTNADQAKRTAYDEALKAAKAVAAKPGASQAEVEKAKNDLVAAAAALNVS